MATEPPVQNLEKTFQTAGDTGMLQDDDLIRSKMVNGRFINPWPRTASAPRPAGTSQEDVQPQFTFSRKLRFVLGMDKFASKEVKSINSINLILFSYL